MSVPPAQLSCQQCTRRKTKCDKQIPTCGACLKANIECTKTQRYRLPRGRTVKKTGLGTDAPLRDRIDRLEAIVQQLQQLQHKSTSWTPSKHLEISRPFTQSSSGPVAESTSSADSFVAPDFWMELTETVAGLRSVLEDRDAVDEGNEADEGNDVENAVSTSHGTASLQWTSPHNSDLTITPGDPHVILFGSSMSHEHAGPSPEMRERLLHVYETRVDAIFKVTHWPSTVSMLRTEDQNSHDFNSLDAGTKALASAIYFTATCSLMSWELDGKDTLVKQYRRNAENALVRAGLLTTKDFVTLQAFVIYLAGLRASLANAQQWTLTATAVRLASAQGIPIQPSGKQASLQAELRKRLWFSIGVLDLQSAFDRGSQTLLGSRQFEVWPLNINDADVSSQTSSPPTDQEHFTDMSFSILIYRAGLCQRRLTEVGSSAANGTYDPVLASYEQVAILTEFERHVRQLPALCDVPPSPIQSFTIAVAEESLVAMRLLLHRPLHRRGNGCVPPDYGTTETFSLLASATEVLERSQSKRSWVEFAQWAWFSWVKWYALAVVLAELCTARGTLADRAWDVAQRSYDDYARIVADTKSGLLWKPIMKLMHKVRQVREGWHESGQHQEGTSIDSFVQQQYLADSSDTNTHTVTGLLPSLSVTSSDLCPTDTSLNANGNGDLYAQKLQDTSGQGTTSSDDTSWLYWDLLISDISDSTMFDSTEF